MARQVTIRTLCDVCLKDSRETEAEELPPLNLVGNKPRILALCDEHSKPYDDLVSLIKDFGQIVDIDGEPPVKEVTPRRPRAASKSTPTVAANSGGEYECPECDNTFGTPQGLGAHRFRSHGVRSEQTRAIG